MIDFEYFKFIKIKINPFCRFFRGIDTEESKHLSDHFTEEFLDHVDSGIMFRGKYKFKSFQNLGRVFSGFLGSIRSQIVKRHQDFVALGIFCVKNLQTSNIILADAAMIFIRRDFLRCYSNSLDFRFLS